MKHFIRSVKYFFHFVLLMTAIILVLIFIGAVKGDINEIFEGGYDALWKIAVFFALIAAVYPKVAFINRRLDIEADWETVRDKAASYLRERRFTVETDEDDRITFRRIGLGARIARKGEDRITLTKTSEGFYMEGPRKDILLFATGLETAFPAN